MGLRWKSQAKLSNHLSCLSQRGHSWLAHVTHRYVTRTIDETSVDAMQLKAIN